MNAEAKASDCPERDIFFEAIEKASEADRAAYVEAACEGDGSLRRRVEVLLADHAGVDDFMQTPVAEIVGLDPPRAAPAEQPGSLIGRYKLLEPIGEGGFGVVYRAEQQEPLRRQVALKIIKPGMDTRQVIARFEAERQALALMNHPNIARVLDGGVTETGRPYFVMELVQGIPITRFCEDHRLSIKERLELFIPVCQAIQHAHQKGVIHRDIKPSNVLVTRAPDGSAHPMVIDFGVAKAIGQPLTDKPLHTSLLQMIGTPAYMSPEQAERAPGGVSDVDTRSDVYSLGILLYELLTGTTPFPEERLRQAGFAELQRIITQEDPERPSTRLANLLGSTRAPACHQPAPPAVGSGIEPEPRRIEGGFNEGVISRPRGRERSPLGHRSHAISTDLDWIVLKAIDKDRNHRYATPNELAADIRRHLDDKPILARPISQTARVWRWCRRHTAVTALSVGLVVALGAGFGGTVWQLERAERNAAENLRQVARLNVLTGINLLQEGDSFKTDFAEGKTI